MILKKLASICKSEGIFMLRNRVDKKTGEVIEQWLGIPSATYLLTNLPFLQPDNLSALFDITAKQEEKIRFTQDGVPDGFNFSDTDEKEIMLEPAKMSLGYGGRIVRPFITSTGLEFINDDYFAPLADVADMLEVYERRSSNNAVYFALKTGLVIVGIVMPLRIIDERLVENMESMAAKCRAALNSKRQNEQLNEK